MISKENTLFGIPKRLFEELRDPKKTLETKEWESCGPYRISVSTGAPFGEENWLPFLVLEEHWRTNARMCHDRLGIFHYPVEATYFPDYRDVYRESDLVISSGTSDPPWDSNRNLMRKEMWRPKQGYWIIENLSIHTRFMENIRVIHSEGDTGFFNYIVEVLMQLSILTDNTPQRGHWQSEWNPDGDYSEKFELKD